MDDEENMSEDSPATIEVELHNKFPKIQGFGLDIAGGTDRPYIKEDQGIFISALKQNGLAEKSKDLSVGDKILEVNGKVLTDVSHDEAVELFTSDRSCVKLKIHRNRAQLLKAAALSPPSRSVLKTPLPSSDEPKTHPQKHHDSRRQHSDEIDNNLSISGFLIGIVLGCVGVVLFRRYINSPRKM